MSVGTTILNETRAGHTLLIVFSPSKNERMYQMQMQSLSDRYLTLNSHNIVVAEVFEVEEGHIGQGHLHGQDSSDLRQEYHIQPGQFKVVLVGKDASVKLCAESCVSCEEVLMRVDNEPEEMELMYC